MFFFSSLSPYRGEIKTLRFDYNPIRSGRLGTHTDLDGNKWDVNGLQTVKGEYYIIARPASKYMGTNSIENIDQTYSWNPMRTWIPYKVEIVNV